VKLISEFGSGSLMEKFFSGGENFWAELGRAWGGGEHWANSTVSEAILERKSFGMINK
jgi:hypothetical protein